MHVQAALLHEYLLLGSGLSLLNPVECVLQGIWCYLVKAEHSRVSDLVGVF